MEADGAQYRQGLVRSDKRFRIVSVLSQQTREVKIQGPSLDRDNLDRIDIEYFPLCRVWHGASFLRLAKLGSIYATSCS